MDWFILMFNEVVRRMGVLFGFNFNFSDDFFFSSLLSIIVFKDDVLKFSEIGRFDDFFV